MTQNRSIPRWLAACALSAGLALLGSAAGANHITSCNDICVTSDLDCTAQEICVTAVSGRCELRADLSCAVGQGPIRLRDATDLDLAGFEISCTGGDCGDAVEIEESGSRVFSSVSEGVISGRFARAVDCTGQANSEVDGITVLHANVGAFNCAKVRNSVFTDAARFGPFADAYGVWTIGVANTDFIRNNYVGGGRTVSIRIGGTTDVEVEDNVVDAGAIAAIWYDSPEATADCTDNVFLGGDDTIFQDMLIRLPAGGVPSGASFTGNVCDPDHPDCQNCVDLGLCEEPVSPFRP